jgi:hypothetical protein
MTLYDAETRCFIDNEHEIAGLDSRMDLVQNADGSVEALGLGWGVGPRHVLDYSALRSQRWAFPRPISSFSSLKRGL